MRADNWYCSEACELGAENEDGVLRHSKSLLWKGLFFLANDDAIKEGNGPAILRYWRAYLPSFWNLKHTKYVMAAHRLLISEFINVLECLSSKLHS